MLFDTSAFRHSSYNMRGARVMAVYELLLISLVGLTATSLAESKSLCL